MFLTCPTGKWCFLSNSNKGRTVKLISLVKKLLGLIEMTLWLVNASFSLPEWQAVKIISFAPWPSTINEVSRCWENALVLYFTGVKSCWALDYYKVVCVQWRIQGRGPRGAGPPIFRPKNFFDATPPPLILGSGWPGPPLIWRSGSATGVGHNCCFNFFFNSTWYGNQNYPPVYPVNILLLLMICIQGSKLRLIMVANVTDIFSLATKNSGLEATLDTRFRFQRFKENESWKFSCLGVTELIIMHTLSLGTMRIAVKHWMAAAMTASEESSNAHLRRNRIPASRRTDTILSSRCSWNTPSWAWKRIQKGRHNTGKLCS